MKYVKFIFFIKKLIITNSVVFLRNSILLSLEEESVNDNDTLTISKFGRDSENLIELELILFNSKLSQSEWQSIKIIFNITYQAIP